MHYGYTRTIHLSIHNSFSVSSVKNTKQLLPIVLYGCDAWYHTLRKQHNSQVFVGINKYIHIYLKQEIFLLYC
jgi:uncharacterized protein YjaZ